jgi:hypothetical protein
MDVFDLRERLIRDCAAYVHSFIQIGDRRISETVDRLLAEGALWSDPLIQLNPSFAPGGSVADLAADASTEICDGSRS